MQIFVNTVESLNSTVYSASPCIYDIIQCTHELICHYFDSLEDCLCKHVTNAIPVPLLDISVGQSRSQFLGVLVINLAVDRHYFLSDPQFPSQP